MGIKFTVQNSQAMGKLTRMMARARKESDRSPEELCAHWGRNIALYLLRRTEEAEHNESWYLNELPILKNWKITRYPKMAKEDRPKDPAGKFHVMAELKKRAKHRTFQAGGWKRVMGIIRSGGPEHVRSGKDLNGAVEIEIQDKFVGNRASITIINSSPTAEEFDAKFGIVEKALEDERRDLAEYIARKRNTTVEKILAED